MMNVKLPPIENILSPQVPISIPRLSKPQSSSTTATTAAKIKPKKRQRKKFEDVKRLYYCDFADCNKGYGSLTHLNEHRVIQQHGGRKKIEDFKHIKAKEKKQKMLFQQQQQERKKIIKLPLLNSIPIPFISTASSSPLVNTTSLSNYHYPPCDDKFMMNSEPPRFYHLANTMTTAATNNVITTRQKGEPYVSSSSSADIIIQTLLKMKNEK